MVLQYVAKEFVNIIKMFAICEININSIKYNYFPIILEPNKKKSFREISATCYQGNTKIRHWHIASITKKYIHLLMTLKQS